MTGLLATALIALIVDLAIAVVLLAADNLRTRRELLALVRDLRQARRPVPQPPAPARHVPRHSDTPTAVLPRQGGSHG